MGVLEEILAELHKINQKLDNLQAPSVKGVCNAEETAELLRISENKVYDLWAKQRLGYVKIGSRKVSTLEQIEKYIKDNSIEGTNQREFRNKITLL